MSELLVIGSSLLMESKDAEFCSIGLLSPIGDNPNGCDDMPLVPERTSTLIGFGSAKLCCGGEVFEPNAADPKIDAPGGDALLGMDPGAIYLFVLHDYRECARPTKKRLRRSEG